MRSLLRSNPLPSPGAGYRGGLKEPTRLARRKPPSKDWSVPRRTNRQFRPQAPREPVGQPSLRGRQRCWAVRQAVAVHEPRRRRQEPCFSCRRCQACRRRGCCSRSYSRSRTAESCRYQFRGNPNLVLIEGGDSGLPTSLDQWLRQAGRAVQLCQGLFRKATGFEPSGNGDRKARYSGVGHIHRLANSCYRLRLRRQSQRRSQTKPNS